MDTGKLEEIDELESVGRLPRSISTLRRWRPKDAIKARYAATATARIRRCLASTKPIDSLADVPTAKRIYIKERIVACKEQEFRVFTREAVALVAIFASSFLALLIAIPLFPHYFSQIDRTAGDPSLGKYAAAYYVALLSTLYLTATVYESTAWYRKYLLPLMLSIYPVAAYLLTSKSEVPSIKGGVRFGLAASFAIVSLTIGFFIFLFYTEKQMSKFLQSRLRKNFSEEYAILSLLGTLSAIKHLKDTGLQLRSPATLSSVFENAARDFSIYLKVRRRSLSGELERMHHSQDRGKVYAILELRNWVLLPISTTLDDAENRIKAYLQAIIKGELGATPWSDPQPVVRRRIVGRTTNAVRAAAFAVAPFLVVSLVPHFHPTLDPSIARYAQILSLLWALLNLLFYVDPHFSDKLDLLQRVKNLDISRGGSQAGKTD